jgi:hypothetical protein
MIIFGAKFGAIHHNFTTIFILYAVTYTLKSPQRLVFCAVHLTPATFKIDIRVHVDAFAYVSLT